RRTGTHRMREAQHGHTQPVCAQRGVVLQEARIDEALGQPADRGTGQAGALGQFAVAENLGTGAERAQDLDTALERAVGLRTGRATPSPAAGVLRIHVSVSCAAMTMAAFPSYGNI